MGVRRIIKEGLGIARGELGETNENHTDGQEPTSEIPWLIPITNAYWLLTMGTDQTPNKLKWNGEAVISIGWTNDSCVNDLKGGLIS